MSTPPSTATEVARRRTETGWQRLASPTWVARFVLLVGLVSVVSALIPALRTRTELLAGLVPAVFPAAATTGAAAVGLILITLAGGLRRGKYRAWLLATILTAVTVVLHLVKGLDVEEALLAIALFVLLLVARPRFTARPDPRSLNRVAAVLVLGTLLATFLGWLWLLFAARGEPARISPLRLLAQSALGLIGIPGPVHFVNAEQAEHSAVALAVLGGAVLVVAMLAALQPAGGPHALTEEEAGFLRKLLGRWGAADSLGYFALREDRSLLVAPSGRAAISYRVVGSVSLSAGDPLGDPAAWPEAIGAWLAEARAYGWVPAVLGASERGAEAYHRAGLDALELGDEALLSADEFTLDGRKMRGVRQAVARCERAGLSVVCCRVADMGPDELHTVEVKADQWRDGEVERGFSMALGRFGDPADNQAVLVMSTDSEGELRGLLHFVPWGADGLSLDLMRRDRESENGVIEQMVATLMAQASSLGVRRVSLNFAVFRNVFARGERLGAGPVLRLWRSLLLVASRWWQIESLYRANAKYQPEWAPRFLCFRSAGDLPRVSVAALRAEAFIVAPRWVRRLER